jgi:hypothetical protein
VTLELFQPAAFGEGAGLGTIVGGFVPIFKVRLALAIFPATSVAVPETVWPAPSALIVCGDGQVAIGAVVFVQSNVTVTLELFHPLGSGAGDAVAMILGGVKAIFNMTFAVAGNIRGSSCYGLTRSFRTYRLRLWTVGNRRRCRHAIESYSDG